MWSSPRFLGHSKLTGPTSVIPLVVADSGASPAEFKVPASPRHVAARLTAYDEVRIWVWPDSMCRSRPHVPSGSRRLACR